MYCHGDIDALTAAGSAASPRQRSQQYQQQPLMVADDARAGTGGMVDASGYDLRTDRA